MSKVGSFAYFKPIFLQENSILLFLRWFISGYIQIKAVTTFNTFTLYDDFVFTLYIYIYLVQCILLKSIMVILCSLCHFLTFPRHLMLFIIFHISINHPFMAALDIEMQIFLLSVSTSVLFLKACGQQRVKGQSQSGSGSEW